MVEREDSRRDRGDVLSICSGASFKGLSVYAVYTFAGAVPNSPNVVDYNAGLPAVPMNLYYHTNEEEKRRMFPADPIIQGTSVTANSVVTTRRARFCEDVAERDGVCVLTGMRQTYCDAVHLLARHKGEFGILNSVKPSN